MDKKKIIQKSLLGFCIVLVVIILVIIATKTDNDTVKIESKPINTRVNLETVFKAIEQIEGFENYEEMMSGEIVEDISGEAKWADEEEIDFGAYGVLEKKAKVNTTEEFVNEVWMIKLGKYEQQEAVCRLLGTRLQKLKAAFAEDEQQSKILQSAVIKQEDGIVIMIISPNVEELEETIAKEMEK